jgi:hypothetical protein
LRNSNQIKIYAFLTQARKTDIIEVKIAQRAHHDGTCSRAVSQTYLRAIPRPK